GHVWFGTRDRGASVLAPDGRWTTAAIDAQGVVEVRAIAADAYGNVWLATPAGVVGRRAWIPLGGR
ncbi:MAG: hypothetical protein DYG90_09505, partial [Chloroflexi bacterium CFX6]|nr:hypothetical protein [Chloroflexi bacterium CFX6]